MLDTVHKTVVFKDNLNSSTLRPIACTEFIYTCNIKRHTCSLLKFVTVHLCTIAILYGRELFLILEQKISPVYTHTV